MERSEGMRFYGRRMDCMLSLVYSEAFHSRRWAIFAFHLPPVVELNIRVLFI